MNISEMYDIEQIIREAEVLFQIDGTDYDEPDIDKVLSRIKQRLGRQVQIDFSRGNMTDQSITEGIYRSQALVFVNSASIVHARLCGLGGIQRYRKVSPISLRDINYLGFTEKSLKENLKALQMQRTEASASESVKLIGNTLGIISICKEKRLFLLLIVAYELGFHEISAAIAELLIMGMI